MTGFDSTSENIPLCLRSGFTDYISEGLNCL